VFDPDRDEDPGTRRYWVRLFTVAAIAVAGCVALLPSVTGFSQGPNQDKGCLAILDGWHADRAGLSASEQATAQLGFAGGEPSPELRQLFQRANSYMTWRDGPGACVPESRHRLIRSGIALGALALFVGGLLITARTRTNLRRVPAELRGA
jgi:hypothetical protein